MKLLKFEVMTQKRDWKLLAIIVLTGLVISSAGTMLGIHGRYKAEVDNLNKKYIQEINLRDEQIAIMEAKIGGLEDVKKEHEIQIEKLKKQVPVSRGGSSHMRYLGNFEVTKYNDYGTTASGKTTTAGVTVAVDTKVIPFGTKIYIEGIGTRIAQDTGSAVKGFVVDVYDPSPRKNLLEWGRQKKKVYILE